MLAGEDGSGSNSSRRAASSEELDDPPGESGISAAGAIDSPS
jgi:hypothetical protein